LEILTTVRLWIVAKTRPSKQQIEDSHYLVNDFWTAKITDSVVNKLTRYLRNRGYEIREDHLRLVDHPNAIYPLSIGKQIELLREDAVLYERIDIEVRGDILEADRVYINEIFRPCHTNFIDK
jgi:hypothetical protein